MNYYGVTFAVIPKKDNPDSYSVICTPIVMDQADQSRFHVLEDLKYTQDFNSLDMKSTVQAFIKMVNTIDSVISLQERSCKEACIDYAPIALKIGQHSQHQVQQDGIYTLLFGKVLESRNSFVDNDKQKATQQEIDKYQPIREAYLAKNKKMPFLFKEASKKLPAMIKKCVFFLGNYKPNSKADDPALLTPNALDEELNILKPLFEQGDADAFKRIKEIAAEMGEKHYKMSRFMPLLSMPAPRDYASNPELQEKLPRFSFFYWDPAFKDAFMEAYSKGHWRNGYHSLKLPLDPPHPFFTDPLADMIRTQFQIIEGKRDPQHVWHHNSLLEMTIAAILPASKQEAMAKG